jgi:hypothetical protein
MTTAIAMHIHADFTIIASEVDNPFYTAAVSVESLDTTGN